MSRALKDDYSELVKFIDHYSIRGAYDEDQLEQIVKPLHKGYFSALVVMAELRHQHCEPTVTFDDASRDNQVRIFHSYLAECVSELGSAFFLFLNGCYKAAEQVMRSSVENFVKAIGSTSQIGLTELKNVYEVFDRAGAVGFFSQGLGKDIHKDLSDLYGSLCSPVHTGTEQDMQEISSLGDFPAIDIERAKKTQRHYLRIVRLYVSSLSVLFDGAFHKMHHTNRDIVQVTLMPVALMLLNKGVAG
jgi:hypothetical protein